MKIKTPVFKADHICLMGTAVFLATDDTSTLLNKKNTANEHEQLSNSILKSQPATEFKRSNNCTTRSHGIGLLIGTFCREVGFLIYRQTQAI